MSLITEIEFINNRKSKSYLKGLNIDLHDHLTDQADWNAEYWDFDSDYLHEYSKILEHIISKSTHGIEFQAMWVGEHPDKLIELSPSEFLQVVRSNKIGTSTRYTVRKNAG
jgi:hypothetical protein